MVLLTMTSSIVEVLSKLEKPRDTIPKPDSTEIDSTSTVDTEEPSLENPKLGNPISHGQITNLWRKLQSIDPSQSLEQLLRGANVYIPPPPSKPEPSPEYKALMARLRRDEEARSYERMMNPAARQEALQSRFPNVSAHAFSEVNKPTKEEDLGDDEISYNEVHRQVTLIINFLVSIAGVAGTLWVVARWWSTPSRLFLTLWGSILVGIAEVVVYSGYMWRLEQASKKESVVQEVKQVVESWVVGEDVKDEGDGDDKMVLLKSEQGNEDDTVRRRKGEKKTET